MNHVLWRILGNDVPPRHVSGQTLQNTRFLLDNEADFEDCEKKFLLNRIEDPEAVKQLRSMLDGYDVHEIPFEPDEYRAIGLPKKRLLYLTNQNAARNYCLDHSEGFDYVMPFDGGVFIRVDGWEEITTIFVLNPDDAFWAVPMSRTRTYDDITSGQIPTVKEEFKMGQGGRTLIGMSEPQVVFTPRSDLRFREDLPYGKGNKAYILWQLGLAGVWDRWHPAIRKEALAETSEHYGKIRYAGFVFRMPSGNVMADSDNWIRGDARQKGMMFLRKQMDEKYLTSK